MIAARLLLCFNACLYEAPALGACRDSALPGCLADLTDRGYGALGATHEFVRACGDENPVLDLLAHPEWLPAEGHTRRMLGAGLAPAAALALEILSTAFQTLRAYAEDVWLLAVEYAHGCLVAGACGDPQAAPAALRGAHAGFLRAMASFLGLASAGGRGARWVGGIGEPTHIIAKSAFAAGHLEFAASVIGGLATMQPEAAIGVLNDLAFRVASANCEMLAQLVAHFTVTELRAGGSVAAGDPSFPQLEFHGGACCRRWHVLSSLISMLLADGAGAQGPQQRRSPLRVVEIGVNNAITSEYLLSQFPDIEFDGIDPYIGAEDIHEEAARRLARFGGRARLWHSRSDAAAAGFVPHSLDLVFIDGDHGYEAVGVDLRLWRPRVRRGGLLAGHDLFNPAFDGVLEALLDHVNATTGGPEVAPATFHFAPDYVWWLSL